MDDKTALLRSWTFVPGDRPRMIDKALALPVDAILLDIEDGVAPAAKETARKQIADSLDRIAAQKKDNPSLRTPARYVRINAVGHDRMHADVEYVIRPGLEGLAVPKVETPSTLRSWKRFSMIANRKWDWLVEACACFSRLKARKVCSTPMPLPVLRRASLD